MLGLLTACLTCSISRSTAYPGQGRLWERNRDTSRLRFRVHHGSRTENPRDHAAVCMGIETGEPNAELNGHYSCAELGSRRAMIMVIQITSRRLTIVSSFGLVTDWEEQH